MNINATLIAQLIVFGILVWFTMKFIWPIDGKTVSTCPVRITSYAQWDTGVIDRIPLGEGQALTVGLYVRCEGAGNGAWGKIDDGTLCTAAE